MQHPRLVELLAAVEQHLVPVMQRVTADDAVENEWVAFDEFFCGLTRREHTEGAERWRTVRAGHEQNAPGMKLVEPRAMGGKVLLRLEHAVRGDLVEHQHFHRSSLLDGVAYDFALTTTRLCAFASAR